MEVSRGGAFALVRVSRGTLLGKQGRRARLFWNEPRERRLGGRELSVTEAELPAQNLERDARAGVVQARLRRRAFVVSP